MLEFNMQDSGGGEAAAGKGLRRVGARLPCEHPQGTESLLAQHRGHPNWLASSQHSTVIFFCPVLNYPFPLPPFPAKVREAQGPPTIWCLYIAHRLL